MWQPQNSHGWPCEATPPEPWEMFQPRRVDRGNSSKDVLVFSIHLIEAEVSRRWERLAFANPAGQEEDGSGEPGNCDDLHACQHVGHSLSHDQGL